MQRNLASVATAILKPRSDKNSDAVFGGKIRHEKACVA
jgi:hypothetical protein